MKPSLPFTSIIAGCGTSAGAPVLAAAGAAVPAGAGAGVVAGCGLREQPAISAHSTAIESVGLFSITQ